MSAELTRFSHLLDSINVGKVNIITGNNGAGKSRFIATATTKILGEPLPSKSKFRHVLCLSGTHNDKFPREIWQLGSENPEICYLGYKVANNMISDIAPFRVIVKALLGKNATRRCSPEAINFCLQKLNIDAEIKLHFRYGKNRKDSLSEFVSKEIQFDIQAFQSTDKSLAIASALEEKDLSLQTISVKRESNYYTLSDLSSGERAYMVALLGALYCAQDNSLIFFDEPENSLHPAWQRSILKDFRKTLELNNIDATILVATHSPLIAGSISNHDAFTCNFPNGQKWQESDLYGKTTDNTLKNQFNLYSSRSTTVVELTQKCLSYITEGDFGSPRLYEAIDLLLSLDLKPEPGDPMHEILQTLEHLREHHELP
ncbi:AAA family ATPase [Stutzerimonas decontaminans]|uniref:AAA family ATPase n=1 Tax=Stutzerimonas decontaminans TaxID=3022791 RepID=UPI0009B925D3|nr:AAA family ATPase [Stutzerimonas decontaminans]